MNVTSVVSGCLAHKAAGMLVCLAMVTASGSVLAEEPASNVSDAAPASVVASNVETSPPVAAPTATAATPDASGPAPADADVGNVAKSRRTPFRTVGVMAGSAGLASVGASLILGILAKGKTEDANALCAAGCTPDRSAVLAHEAGTFATASTMTFAAGLALVSIGAGLYFFAPTERVAPALARLRIGPDVGIRNAGMTSQGAF